MTMTDEQFQRQLILLKNLTKARKFGIGLNAVEQVVEELLSRYESPDGDRAVEWKDGVARRGIFVLRTLTASGNFRTRNHKVWGWRIEIHPNEVFNTTDYWSSMGMFEPKVSKRTNYPTEASAQQACLDHLKTIRDGLGEFKLGLPAEEKK